MIQTMIAAPAAPTCDNVVSKSITSNPTINSSILTQDQVRYQSEVTTAKLGDKVIRLENLTPILSPKEREEREREIESRLFQVFVKYVDK